MKTFKAEEFRRDIITKRIIEQDLSMYEASKSIGISKPTLSRIESLKTPDLETFFKIVIWLKEDANKYINK